MKPRIRFFPLLILRSLSVLGILTVAGCASGPSGLQNGDPPLREDTARSRIQADLQEGQYGSALMQIDRYRTRARWDYPWLDILEQQALQTAAEEAPAALRADAVERSLELLQVLYKSDAQLEDHDALYGRVLLRQFQQELSEQRSPLAIAAFLELLGHSLPDREVINQGMELIYANRDTYAFERALGLLDQAEYGIDALREEYQFEQISPSRQLPGSATIWVNKGISLDNGTGRPDRMIGSGFFIDPQGYLLTNYHVIESEVNPEYEGYSRAYIRPHEAPETRIPAKVIGFDPILDLALLKVPYEPQYVFPISGVRNEEPGNRIYAIGSPGGLANTITSGIISATGRRFLQLGEALQVDAPLNPGNSGGPVLNQDGDMVGVVYAGVPQFDGINFAVPSFWVRGVLSRLYEAGQVQHPYVGISVHEHNKGLEITHVIVGSPADQAELAVGDIITGIDGQELEEIDDANRLLHRLRPGDMIRLQLRVEGGKDTNGDRRSVEQRLILGERPERPLEKSLDGVSRFPSGLFPPLVGMYLQDVRRSWFANEFFVERVLTGSPADEAGLSARDPVALQRWEYDDDSGVLSLYIRVKKRRSGYMDSSLLLPVHIETTNVL